MSSLLFYVSQNVCKKSGVFADRRKLASEKDRISAIFGFEIA
jgi:hypothetical protein